MMKNKFLFLIYLTNFCCYSCNQSVNSELPDIQLIKLNVTSSAPYIKTYSSVFSDIRRISLETSQDCLIGNIKSVRIVENEIFLIQETSNFSSLLRFSKEGKFLNEFGSYGRGPEEMMNPRDFYVENDIVEIWSRLNISQFTMNGKYIKKIFNAYVPGVGFFKNGGYYYLYHSASNPNMLTKNNSKGVQITKYLPYKYMDARTENDKVLLYDNNISLFCGACDTIYCFDNGKIMPKAYFNFEKFLPVSQLIKKEKNITKYLNIVNNDRRYCRINNYFENSHYIVFEFIHDRISDYCIYNKETKKSYYFNSKLFDSITKMPFSNPICLTTDDFLILPAYVALRRDQNLINIDNSVYDNPVLFFCKLKSI